MSETNNNSNVDGEKTLNYMYKNRLGVPYKELRFFKIGLVAKLNSKEKVRLIDKHIDGVHSFWQWEDEPWMRYVYVKKTGEIYIRQGKEEHETVDARRNHIIGRMIATLTEYEKEMELYDMEENYTSSDIEELFKD